jgi:dihydroxyacetone kinase-like protein
MKRGFDAVLADAANLSAKPWPDFLKGVGTMLVMKVGGASGPLYGTLFMALGKDLPVEPTRADLVRAFRAAIAAVQARGKSERGQKTMLDVLFPVAEALEAGTSEAGAIARAAHAAAEATIPVRAVRGRASFLGDRSIGHMDPGARSSALLIEAIASVLEKA